MQKHFVVFSSPGTFVHEETTKEIDSWDVGKAIAMSKEITERYGSKPFGFRFITRSRKDNELDSKQIDQSGMYFLGGRIMTVEEVEDEDNPDNQILIQNMRTNNIDRVVRNDNSWRVYLPMGESDTLLDI